MPDTLNNFGETIVNNLTNAGMTDLIIYGIGFIGFCILGSLLTRKDRKVNPEKYAPINTTLPSQDYSMGTIVINGQSHSITRAGNTTYID